MEVKADKVTLGYWNIRGLAEKVRILLEYLHIPYDQKIFTPETRPEWFDVLKPQYTKKNPAANLPFLLDGEKLISQSNAILVYLCHRANRKDLLGQNSDDQVTIATVLGVFADLHKSYLGFVYGPKTYEEFKDEAYKSMKTHLTKLNGLLGEKNWFCSKLSFSDFIVAEFIQGFSLFQPSFEADFPHLKAHQQRIWQLDGVSQYVKSERFKERPVNYYPYAKWY